MSLPDGQSATEIGAAVGNAVREHSTFFLIEGIILIILGALAIFLTPFATISRVPGTKSSDACSLF
jgi:uncharacterized membrane protein HdeD (DUF308 family)